MSSDFLLVSVPGDDETSFRNLMRAGASSQNPYGGELFFCIIFIIFFWQVANAAASVFCSRAAPRASVRFFCLTDTAAVENLRAFQDRDPGAAGGNPR